MKFTLYNAQQGHKELTEAWKWAKSMMAAGHKLTLEIKPETRSTEQNAVLWARLTDIADQINWYGKKLSPQDWKHIFSSSLRKLEVVPNLDGTGFVALGLSTSKMTKGEMQELNELILAFGAQHEVNFSVASLCGEPS